MRAQLCFYLFWWMLFHCSGEPNYQKQWLNSVTRVISPLSTSNNIPRLLSITETCQGLILSEWWVLSTTSCLTKLKDLQHILEIKDQESILLSHKICLHPSFDLQEGTNTIKEDIGMLLLQYPFKREERLLSHTNHFFWKSCSTYQPRYCRIYQYKNDHFSTRIKMLAVKILDLSFCRHQHLLLTKRNNLCIQTQPQEDCWVKQGSPLLCYCGNHWNLIGLSSESSVTCSKPIPVIKTTPYLPWIRCIINTFHKPSNPSFSIPNIALFEIEHHPQDTLNRNSAIFFFSRSSIQSWRLMTLPLYQKCPTSPAIFGSNIKDSFPNNRQLHVQLDSTIKFKVTQSQTQSNKFPFYSQPQSSPWIEFISDIGYWTSAEPDKTVMALKPKERSIRTQVHRGDGSITSVVKPINYNVHLQACTMVNKIELQKHTVLYIEVSDSITANHTLDPSFQPIINIVGTQEVLGITPENVNTPEYKSTKFQATSAILMSFTWSPSAKNTLDTLKMVSCSQYKSIMPKHVSHLQITKTAIKHELNLLPKPQFQTKDKMKFLISTIDNVPFSNKKVDFIRPWLQTEVVKTWAPNPTIRPLTQLKDDLIQPWLHPRIKRLRRWILPKFQKISYRTQMKEIKDNSWTHSEAHDFKPWTYTEEERIRPWYELENNIGRGWLYDPMKPATQSDLKKLDSWAQPDINTWRQPEMSIQSWPKPEVSMLRPWTRFEMDVVGDLLHTQTDTIRTWNQLDSQTTLSFHKLEADRMNPWYQTQRGVFKSWLETKVHTQSWPQLEGDPDRLWPHFADHNAKFLFQKQIQTVTLLETATQTAYYWSQSEDRPWKQPFTDKDNWIHEANKVGPWDEFEGEKNNFRIQPEIETRPWMQPENDIINPLGQSESSTIILYMQNESSEVNFWTQSEDDTVIPNPQILSETFTKWEMTEFLGLSTQYSVSESVIPWTQTESVVKYIWTQSVNQGEPSDTAMWKKSIADTITTWTQDKTLIVNPWKQSENITFIAWKDHESLATSLWTQSVSDMVTQVDQSRSSEIIFWTKVVSNRFIPWPQTGPWVQSEIDSFTLSTQASYITKNTMLNTVTEMVTEDVQFESNTLNSCINTKADTITLCVQAESQSYSWANYESNIVSTWILEESLLLRPFEIDSISTRTKKRNQETNSWTQSEADTVTTWNHAETPGVNSWIKSTADTVTSGTESLELNSWTEVEHSVTLATKLELSANTWTKTLTSMVSSWTRESSLFNLQMLSTITVDMPWSQTGYPEVNSSTNSILQWTLNKTSEINHRSQTYPPSIQGEFPEAWSHPLTQKITPLSQAESSHMHIWAEEVEPSLTFWSPPWTTAAVSNIISVMQTEYYSVNRSETTNNTVTLHFHGETQIENVSTLTVPGTFSMLNVATIMPINSWPHLMTETIIPQMQNESLVNVSKQSITYSFKSYTQTSTLPVNLLTKSNDFAFRNKVESLGEHVWTKFVSETIVENFLLETVKVWTPPETGTVTFSIQDEPLIMRLWTQSLVSPQWTQSKSLSISIWTQPQLSTAKLWAHYDLPTVNVTDFSSIPPTPSGYTETSMNMSYTQTLSPSLIPWTGSVASILISQTGNESLSITAWIISTAERNTHIFSDYSLSLSFLTKAKNDTGKMLSNDKSPVNLATNNVVSKITVLSHIESLASSYLLKNMTTITLLSTSETRDESPRANIWLETLVSIATPWTQANYPAVETAPQDITSTVISWNNVETQILISRTEIIASPTTSWNKTESLRINSLTDAIASTMEIQNIAEYSTIKSRTQWIWAEMLKNSPTETLVTRVIPRVQGESPKVDIETSLMLKAIQLTHSLYPGINMMAQTLNYVVLPGTPALSMVYPLTTDDKVTSETLAEYIIKSSHTTNGVNNDLIWTAIDTDSKKGLSLPESILFSISLHTQNDNILSLMQFKTKTSPLWSYTENDIHFNVQTLPISGTILPLPQGVRFISQSEDNSGLYWLNIHGEKIITWAQSEFQISSMWAQFGAWGEKPISQYETVSSIHTKTKSILPWSHSERDIVKHRMFLEATIGPWLQTKVGMDNPWALHKNYLITTCTQFELEAASLCTQAYVNTAPTLIHTEVYVMKDLNIYDEITNKPLIQSQTQIGEIKQGTKITTVWIQSTWEIDQPGFQSETKRIKLWTQSESQLVTAQVGTYHETSLIRSWTKIKTDIVQPWIYFGASTFKLQPQIISIENKPSTQTEVNSVVNWFQIQKTSVNHWIHSQIIRLQSWVPPEINAIPILTKREKQGVKPLTLAEAERVTPSLQTVSFTSLPWIQSELSPIQFIDDQLKNFLPHTETVPWPLPINSTANYSWIYSETQAGKPWIELEVNTEWSWDHMTKIKPGTLLQTQLFNALDQSNIVSSHSWIWTETQIVRPRFHSESDISSFATPNLNNISIMYPPEAEIIYVTYYKTDIITSVTSKIESSSFLASYFSSWFRRYPFLPIEITSSDKPFTAVSTGIATEEENQINCFHSTIFTDSFLFTPASICFTFVGSYQNVHSKLEITKTVENFTIPPSSDFTPVIFPLASSNNSLQELPFDFTNNTISPIFPSLQSSFDTNLAEQTLLMAESQPGTWTNQLNQNSLKYLELNVSLAECRLRVVWKESLQTFWLFKTAVISHETPECGLRPGFISNCPNCWEAEVGEFPWIVSVQLSFAHFCAGSVLNAQWILTTARCANFIKHSEALTQIQAGLNDLQDPSKAQTAEIHRVIPYFGFKGLLGPGLIYLKKKLHFRSLVLPICLEESLEQGKNIQLYDCWLMSWSFMRGNPRILQKRHLNVLHAVNCAQFWPELSEFTFCIEAKKAMGEAGCKGDLGAPLVCKLLQKDTWVQIGILTNFDENCKKPYVFSQVSPFVFWIQGVTHPSHAPWFQQRPVTTSNSSNYSVSTSANASATTSAYIHPHFISLPQPQILADHISLRYAMPWQVLIISCGSSICSGSIVSSSWVLTAAHCLKNKSPEDLAVVLGLSHPGAPLQIVKVSSILLHERYRLVSGAARNDLALLLLQESQSQVQPLAPLGNLKNLNNLQCLLSGPRKLRSGETDENPEMLQIQLMKASSCQRLYPDISSSIVCFITQVKALEENFIPVSPGSAVMCRPVIGTGSWKQIGLTSVKALATILSPHFSWILSVSKKAGHPLNQAVMPWVGSPNSSNFLKHTEVMSLFTLIIFIDLTLL